MKTAVQSLKTGITSLVESPTCESRSGEVLIKTSVSLISPGTERMLVQFGKSSLLGKAIRQPERVREVLAKIKTDGLFSTIDAVSSKLEQPLVLGYSNVGVVVEATESSYLKVGDRVVSNGPHGEFVSVPERLVSKIPDGVDNEDAVFAILGSIALEACRQLIPQIGETQVVQGCGIVGLLATRILQANGCNVVVSDFNSERLRLAQEAGTVTVDLSKGQKLSDVVKEMTSGYGADGALIATSTQSQDPLLSAAHACRHKGKIVLVGTSGTEIPRRLFFDKGLSFSVSSAYGPGRYDKNYELGVVDYPIGYVRWTAERNIEAVLSLMAQNKLSVKDLVTSRHPFEDLPDIYESILFSGSEVGVLLNYEDASESVPNAEKFKGKSQRSDVDNTEVDRAYITPLKISVIGAGNYAARTLLPAFSRARSVFCSIYSRGGVSAAILAQKFKFKSMASTSSQLLEDDSSAVLVVTHHDSHAEYAISALKRNKHVFVEKPLCLTLNELMSIQAEFRQARERAAKAPLRLMVGFNRRFSSLSRELRSRLDRETGTSVFLVTVNAGRQDRSHWTIDKFVGGGRIIGEACHFVDLLRYLSNSRIKEYAIEYVDKVTDNAIIQLRFDDGSRGIIHYLTSGASTFAKERIEVFKNGKIFQLDNFKKLKAYGAGSGRNISLWKQDKGQHACAEAFVAACQSAHLVDPIDVDELFEVAEVMIDLAGRL